MGKAWRVPPSVCLVVLGVILTGAAANAKEWKRGDKPAPKDAALLQAVQTGEGEEVLKKHVAAGANINAISAAGLSSLLVAVADNKVATAEALVRSRPPPARVKSSDVHISTQKSPVRQILMHVSALTSDLFPYFARSSWVQI